MAGKSAPYSKTKRCVMAKVLLDELLWAPNPGPQTDAYFSDADILLYGGQAGGGIGFYLPPELGNG